MAYYLCNSNAMPIRAFLMILPMTIKRDNYVMDALWCMATDMRYKDTKNKKNPVATLERWEELNKPAKKKIYYTRDMMKKRIIELKKQNKAATKGR
jgi:hypothetical protein